MSRPLTSNFAGLGSNGAIRRAHNESNSDAVSGRLASKTV